MWNNIKVNLNMRIGFDLDGVVASASIPIFRLADHTGNKNKAEDVYKWSFRTSNILLNPVDFVLFGKDEIYLITSRPLIAKKITEEWTEKYVPHYKKLLMLDLPLLQEGATKKEVEAWLTEMGERKAKAINEHKIDVYFEDSTFTVKVMRKLCPNCKVINYGGRI